MRLKELRKSKGLTQDELASSLNIQQQTYGKYELNKREPDIQTLCKIADYYGVSLDYLCEHEQTTESKSKQILKNLSNDFKKQIDIVNNIANSFDELLKLL